MATFIWMAIATPAAAHTDEVIRFGSFLGGLTHPVLGPDHLLAMLSVGIVSVQIGGRAILFVPAMFVTFMAIGGLAGVLWGGIEMTFIETGIAASVLILGVVIAGGRALLVLVALAAVSIFGFMHGYAHGVETPSIAQPALYAAGFLMGTAIIHLAGVLIGEVARRYPTGPTVLRFIGAGIATMGALFLLGVL